MCHTVMSDIYCRNLHCNNILTYNAPIEHVKCQIVIDRNEEFGWCGRKGTEWCADQVRSNVTCSPCQEMALREQNRIYQNLGQHVAQNRADQQKLDDNRGARAERRRQAAHLPDTLFEEYAALVSSVGTQWSISGEGDAHGASGRYAYPGQRGNEIPPEHQWGMDDSPGEGWNDPGEGSSRSYDERHTHGGGHGQNQRSGHY